MRAVERILRLAAELNHALATGDLQRLPSTEEIRVAKLLMREAADFAASTVMNPEAALAMLLDALRPVQEIGAAEVLRRLERRPSPGREP